MNIGNDALDDGPDAAAIDFAGLIRLCNAQPLKAGVCPGVLLMLVMLCPAPPGAAPPARASGWNRVSAAENSSRS
jgi:hypothetical protein